MTNAITNMYLGRYPGNVIPSEGAWWGIFFLCVFLLSFAWFFSWLYVKTVQSEENE